METTTSTLKVVGVSLPIGDWSAARKRAAAQGTTAPAVLRILLARWLQEENTPENSTSENTGDNRK